jgi:HlyD family secretion protein
MKKRIIVFALVLVIAAGFVYYVVRNRETTGEANILVSGTIELTEVDCAFRISGMIEELRFDEGDSVKEGDLIARLDDREPRAYRPGQGEPHCIPGAAQ